MNMWALLMIVLFVLAFVGILYLASRIRKFAFFKRITKEKRIVQIGANKEIWEKDVFAVLCRNRSDCFYGWISGNRLVSGTSCLGDNIRHTDRQSSWKAKSSSTFRFTYRNNISWRRLCRAYEGYSESKSRYCIDCRGFCG